LCCRVARVSRQAFYGWRCAHAAGPTPRERTEAALVAEIREIHAGSGGAYGSPRVTAELRARGHHVNVKRVARLMRAHQIVGICPRRPKRTTIAARGKPKLPDLVCREFSPGAPDRAWCSDITYIRTGEGWLYLAVVLDVGSRRLLGYAMSDRIDTRLVADAVDMAGDARGGRTTGIVLHSDHGAQYLSAKLRDTAAGWGLAQSVGRVGSSADNAMAEAFFSSLKRELVNRHRYPDRATARRSVFEWLTRYNTHRRHTSLGYLTPDQHEAHYRHTAGTTPALST
jgi:transposase InsO family protein